MTNPARIAETLLATVLTGGFALSAMAADKFRQGKPPVKIDDQRLQNTFRVHQKVLTGAQPDENGFGALAELGVKTLISVDGAQPDVLTAKKYGLKYVHLPHGYDGVPERRAKELAKAVHELEGPIYIHCHHGKHRSPAAAATACVGAGLIAPADSLAVLEAAGTDKGYRGLYKSARNIRPFDPIVLEKLVVHFREREAIPPMAEAMVELGRTYEHLKIIANADWKTPPEHPDLDPAHEALLMREHYTELLRTDEVCSKPTMFQELMHSGERGSRQLRRSLLKWQSAGASGDVPTQVHHAFNLINQSCSQCHKLYRNTPIDEK